jgi:putative ABC transport system substrate-binding protein
VERREFITGLVGAAAWPLVSAQAQQPPKMLRLGTVSTLPRERPTLRAFEQRLRELGYVEGVNFLFDYTIERNVLLHRQATEDMVRRKVDIVLATNGEVLREAMAATDTLPIVIIALDFDPFDLGYVTSLSRPTGNVTGVFLQQVELAVKRLQMLKEAFPDVDAATVFWDYRSNHQWHETERAARSLGLLLAGMELRDPPYDYEAAWARAPSDHRGVLLVMSSPFFFGDRQKLADLALRHRIASLFAQREHVDAGGLVSYGPSIPSMYRRLADYVDKIARGAKTTDLPIEQPTKFEFIVNLRTAKSIGRELPTSVLLRADEVIE